MKSCVFFGYSDIGYEALSTLLSMGQKIDAVFTHENAEHEHIWFRSVEDLARTHNIPTYTNTPTLDDLKNFNPDIVLCAYYRTILPTWWLLTRPLGSYNMHGSLLPAYRGAQPTNWAVICGDKKSGITLHAIGNKLDSGDVINVKTVPIGTNDTAFDVMKNIIPMTKALLEESWEALLTQTAQRTPQDEQCATMYPRRTPADGLIDPRAMATSIHNLIRGVTHPYPGAFFTIRGGKVLVWKSELIDVDDSATTGAFVSEGVHPTLKCQQGAVSILEATFEDGSDALPSLNTGTVLDVV